MRLPWRSSFRTGLANGSSTVVATVTGLLLAFVAASAVLCGVASGSAAIAYQSAQGCAQTLPVYVAAVNATSRQTALIAADSRRIAARQGFPRTVIGAYSDAGGRALGPSVAVRLAFRDDAAANLQVRQGNAGGLLLPEAYARDTGAGPGSPGVSGIYSDLEEPVSPFWCTEVDWVTLQTLGDLVSGPIFVPRLDQLTAMADDFTVTAHFPTALPVTMGQAEDFRQRGDALASALKAAFDADGLTGVAVVHQQFPAVLANARQAQDNLIAFVAPLTAVSLLVGLVGVMALATQWCRRRQPQLFLLWARGSGPISLGGMGLLELGGPIVVGAVLGLVAARLTLPWYAPAAELEPSTLWWAALLVVGVVALALLTLTITATTWTHRVFQVRRRGRVPGFVRAIPFELPVLALAVWSWTRLANGMVPADDPAATTHVDPLALAFPVLAVIVVAGLAARVGRLLLAWSHRLNLWTVPSVQLAARRLAAASTAVTGVLLVGVLAVGTFAVGNGVEGAERDALAAKSGTLIGAETSVQVSTDLGQRNRSLPEPLRGNSTLVGRAGTALVVDPDTFDQGAYSTADAVAKLGADGAIAVGHVATGQLSLDGFAPLHTIAAVPSFPGIPRGGGYVVSRKALTDIYAPGSWFVWSAADVTTVTSALAAAGIERIHVRTAATSLNALPFLTMEWTFGYIASVGALLAMVAAASLLLAVGARRRQTALSGALAVRMGLTGRTLIASHLIEFGAIAATTLAAGAAVGLVASALSAPRLDPAPWLFPTPQPSSWWPFAAYSLGAALLVVAIAGWLAVRGVRTAKVGELIRYS